MASNPPGACCTVGVRHEGQPTGEMIKIAGKWDGYLAVPPADKEHKDVAILYVPDIFGIWQNSQLIADQLAANGYRTLIADILNGDAVELNMPKGYDIAKWVGEGSDGNNPHTVPAIDPIVEAALKELKSQGAKKVGAVGYCFGAKYVVRHYKSGIDVGFVAHPSFIDDEELEAITGPLSIAAAETDTIFPDEMRHRSEKILKKVGQPWQINLFSGVEHGFSVRGDPKVRIQRWAKEQAFLQAVQWFDEHLVREDTGPRL